MGNADELLIKAASVTVVVPFFNAAGTIADCLNSFAPFFSMGITLIAVDNNSKDGSYAIAETIQKKFCGHVKLLKESRQGPSFARNLGAFTAETEFVAFVDSDCIADPDWLRNIVAPFADQNIVAVAGRIVGYHQERAVDKFHMMFTMVSDEKVRAHRDFSLLKGGFPTGNLAVRRKSFIDIGGFDTSMEIYSEDYDLCARLYQNEQCILYAPDAVIYHQHRSTVSATIIQSFGFGKGHAILLKRHFRHMMIVQGPMVSLQSKRLPVRMWLDFNGMDKKVVILLLSALIWPPFIAGLVVYLLYMYSRISKRAKSHKISMEMTDNIICVYLLFCKSAAMTAGRIYGSLKNKVLCL